jgi:hypothetical protein
MGKLYVDAHVHLRPGHDADAVLDAAAGHAERLSRGARDAAGGLVLVEPAGERRFRRLLRGADRLRHWTAEPTGDDMSLRLRDAAGRRLFLFAGRQIETAERLEALSLLSDADIPDGLPVAETVARVRQAGGLPALPWGFGKWLFARRARLEAFLGEAAPPLFLCDSGGRPGIWRERALFERAARRRLYDLPGSDPLDPSWEAGRAGSRGFVLPFDLEAAAPGLTLRARLAALEAQPATFGRPRALPGFLLSQIALRLAPRRPAARAALEIHP